MLQVLNGNTNRRTKEQLKGRVKQEEKLHVSDQNMDIPISTNAVVKKEYNRIVELFKNSDLLNEADITTLARYADLWGEYVKADRRLTKYGRINQETGKLSPDIALKLKLSAELDKLAKDLGLTPAARASLAISKKDEKVGDDDGDEDF
ncbi:phage terminase small subunit P27 family [Lactobacillus hominis]|nr:phage terminase small subunit P27 family [Lactobacillus hominis]